MNLLPGTVQKVSKDGAGSSHFVRKAAVFPVRRERGADVSLRERWEGVGGIGRGGIEEGEGGGGGRGGDGTSQQNRRSSRQLANNRRL